MTSSEFELIQHYFTGLGEGAAVRLGVGDDAAVLQVPEGHVLQISTDTALEGAHFLANLPAADIAYRSVMAAASDLAAMGAVPMASLLSLTLPKADSAWLRDTSNVPAKHATANTLPTVPGAMGDRPVPHPLATNVAIFVMPALVGLSVSVCKVVIAGSFGNAVTGYPAS